MYVSEITNRFSRGMSTPEIRAMVTFLALSLLVARVLADDLDSPVTADHLALLTDLLDAGSNLHGCLLCFISRRADHSAHLGWEPSACGARRRPEVLYL